MKTLIDHEYDEVMTVQEFEEHVKSMFFVNDDGSGYYCDGLYYDHDNPAIPSEIYKNGIDRSFSHVVWFNK